MWMVGHSELVLQPASQREGMQDRLEGSTHTVVAAGSVAGNVAGEVDTTAVDGIEVVGCIWKLLGVIRIRWIWLCMVLIRVLL